MNREEEIKKAKGVFFASSDDYTYYTKSFEEGAKWADQHPRKGLWDSEKVCNFLLNNISSYISEGDYDYGREYIYCFKFANAEQLVEGLKKAMEE